MLAIVLRQDRTKPPGAMGGTCIDNLRRAPLTERSNRTHTILLGIVWDGLFAASGVGVYLFCIRPQLLARRARWPAFAVSAAIAASVPVSLAATRLSLVPPFVVPLLIVMLLSLWGWPEVLVRLTGGRRPLDPDVQVVIAAANRSWEQFQLGDLAAARAELARPAETHPQVTARYVGLWQRFLDEEDRRRAGSRESSQGTMNEIAEEATRLTRPARPIGALAASLLLEVSALVGAAPAMSEARACIGVLLGPTHASSAPAQPSSLSNSLLDDPEPGAVLQADEAMDVDDAAASRHDPNTLAQLVDDGFVAAHTREWLGADGRSIGVDVFEFRDSEGALAYHRTVSQYACRFSNEAFEGPSNGIGLQVRYSSGDPIVEQFAWVVGTRRYVVAVAALAPPEDHHRVLSIAGQQAEQAVH